MQLSKLQRLLKLKTQLLSLNMSNLIKPIAELLIKNKMMLVTAESCTGGLLASLLTEIPGSSQWFERGFITYSNLSKAEMLAVNTQTLESYGAVSPQVAEAMAVGALMHSTAHLAVAITGIAGPDGGSEAKPVGTVCFAWACADLPAQSQTRLFNGDRISIRLAACEEALQGMHHLLKRISN